MLNAIISFIPKLMLFLCLILVALATKLNSDISKKDVEIQNLEREHVVRSERLDRIEKQLTVIELNVEEARNSWERLDLKLAEIESGNKNYTKEVVKVRTENEKVKSLLDTKLPPDLRRLLNESTASEN